MSRLNVMHLWSMMNNGRNVRYYRSMMSGRNVRDALSCMRDAMIADRTVRDAVIAD